MSVLIGHPTGTPFSHHAALSYHETGQLAAYCLAWMPSAETLGALKAVAPLRPMAERLGRRRFEPLADAPLLQGRLGEWRRLLLRAAGRGGDATVRAANEWVARTLRRECRRAAVSAVHAYEDCALLPFEQAKRLGKACIYDLPIGYFEAWERIAPQLSAQYADWMIPASSFRFASPEQKREELALADLVLAPSGFVADSARETFPDKRIALAPFGVDLAAWPFQERRAPAGVMTVLFAGQCSVRKGTPLLLDAWRAAGLADARLLLAGSWGLAEAKKRQLPANCNWLGPLSQEGLRAVYRDTDVFVLPTNFEGSPLVIGEALACGLPVLTTQGRGADSILDEESSRTVPPDNLDALIEALRWFVGNRDRIPAMSRTARANAERWPWQRYRASVAAAVKDLI